MDPLGKVLLANGALTDELLADVLEQQRRTMPIGSMCYILGILDEETLARALCRQFGMPSVVLERTIVALDALGAVPRDVAMRHNLLPLYEDQQRIFMAAEDPRTVAGILREIRFVRGKMPVVHIALQVTLARAVRACYRARDAGARLYAGPLVPVSERDASERDDRARMFVISTPENTAPQTLNSSGMASVVQDVTKELGDQELRAIHELEDEYARTVETPRYNAEASADRGPETITNLVEVITDMRTAPTGRASYARSQTTTDEPLVNPGGPTQLPSMQTVPPLGSSPHLGPRRAPVLDLDADTGTGHRSAPRPRRDGLGYVLIVDDDFATRHLLDKVLQASDIHTATAATGGEAIRMLRANPPDVIILDVMLPEMDGFQICQAIKQSKKYNHIGVLLMSAVISSVRVTAEILQRYGAEGYYEKPIDPSVIKKRVKELRRAKSAEKHVAADDSFDRAIELYKDGRLDAAIEVLRTGLEIDPLSPKHYFVLANLLQKKSLIYEAIEAYEATVDLKPDYFPALTRLAYLYYKKGFAAKAAQVWERSLPFCTDGALRQNIEEFISTLRAEITSSG